MCTFVDAEITLKMKEITGKVKVINKTDPNSPVISGANKDINCSVVNNFIHSMISKVTYQINDFQMGDSAAKSYSYRAY